MERRLAAILAADMVGYSRLVEIAEEETIRRQKQYRAETIDPLIEEANGHIVKTSGDGMLVEFASAVNAVTCAIEIQERITVHEEAAAEEKRISYRIGINVGDVVFDDGDIYGDGVNVAARLESLADPGGICISATVKDQITGKLDLEFADAGEKYVKNIARPIHTFIWRGAGKITSIGTTTQNRGRKPTVALAEFITLGGGEEASQFAEACQDSVIAGLSNLTGLDLLVDQNKADHIASAKIQVASGHYRASVTLHDRVAATSYMTSQFNGELSDLFATQDALSGRITTAIRYAVLEHEAKKNDPNTQEISGLHARLSRAGQLLMGSNAREWVEASTLIDEFLAAEPDNFMALFMKAAILIGEIAFGWRKVTEDDAVAAADCIRRAQLLNAHSDFGLFTSANYKLFVAQDVAAALRDIDRCLEIHPQYPLGLQTHGLILILSGEVQRGIEQCMNTMLSLTRNRIYHRPLTIISFGYFALGDDGRAIDFAQRALQQEPDYPFAMQTLVAATARAGQSQACRDAVESFLAAHPEFHIGGMRSLPFQDGKVWQAYIDGLRAAGLPE